MKEISESAGSHMELVAGNWTGNCPIHHGDNPTAFVIYGDKDKERWVCYSGDCGHGDIIDLYMAIHKCDFMTAYKELSGELKLDPVEMVRITTERAQAAEKALEDKISKAKKALEELRQAQRWINYHVNLFYNEDARKIWRNKGIPDNWQDIFELGYTDNFSIKTDEGYWNTPTLTIPIFDVGRVPINIRHRLIKPYKPNDKYRPDRPGLAAAPLICDPDNGWDLEHVLVCEGEIKSMVTYFTLDSAKWQVIGLPGKNFTGNLVEKLSGHAVWVCLDPDADEQAKILAKALHGKWIKLPMKIDDAITSGKLKKDGIKKLIREARRDYD
jgi:hypothetical protein